VWDGYYNDVGSFEHFVKSIHSPLRGLAVGLGVSTNGKDVHIESVRALSKGGAHAAVADYPKRFAAQFIRGLGSN
tara:strand:- start:212 stop:436 length:225 start_codon:yes stop_codon:yes gene_type:complete